MESQFNILGCVSHWNFLMISSYSWEVYQFVVNLRQMKPTTDDQVPMFVILKIDEDILGDSKMKINTFIYKLFEIKSADQSRKLLGTKIVLQTSVHNLANFVSNLDVS